MSTFPPQYPYQPHQFFYEQSAFDLAHNDVRRAKTPTDSLINHTGLSPGGHSPGPLITTPPPLSRNHSHQPIPPQDQLPEQSFYDNGSFSNSPTSVRTPDNDSFEVEMLDSDIGRFYQQDSTIMPTQSSQNHVAAVDSSQFFSDQAIQEALNLTMAQQQYQQQLDLQSAQQQNMMAGQPQNAFFGGNFPAIQNQPAFPQQQEPWNGQGPSRFGMTPQPGHVMFDPASDPALYNEFLNNDVNLWAANFTDPTSLVSPSEPTVPPQDIMFGFTAQTPHRGSMGSMASMGSIGSFGQSPVELRFNGALQSPIQNNFVNYDATSTLITDNYIVPNQLDPTSPSNASTGHYSQRYHQPPHSPQPSAPSPSSDGKHSHQNSDHDMYEALRIPQHNAPSFHNSHASSQGSLSPAQPIPEIAFDTSPEPEQIRRESTSRGMVKSGGRALGCSRVKLVDLGAAFIPHLVSQMHEDSFLTQFVSQHIHQWNNVELTVMMTCGQDKMPRIPVKVYEFVPKGDTLLCQIQYRTDPGSNKRVMYRKQSPPLGMVHINYNEEKKYEKYVSDIVDNHLDAFGELCWMEDDNDFHQKLFRLMTRVKPKNEDEQKLFREVNRLIVVTFIMSHTLTIAPETKYATLSRMHSFIENDTYTSPRMTNRQLKYFFHRVQQSIQTTLLNKLQQIFKSSKGCDKWLAAFITIVGMCMALEDQQKTIHLVQTTKSTTEGLDVRDAQAHADHANREIDTQMHFIQQIFRWKYNRKHNPLLNADHDWEKEVGFGDASSVNFVRQVAQLVRENTDYLQHRGAVSISSDNQTKYTARIVGKFLMSFWLPQ
ncbi:hypothetical protein E8E13_009158 [Curvularia kusanoi]|uniref:Uncharacterized protein n=1 Tax=Curvularia kusanoi TaxID=90978 RepID=A0A9P4WAH7_CURKU|nr:hypothetical protein E8E13_009158 [Curvularia kusanoi]